MLEPMSRSNAIGWQFIKNQFAVRTTKEQSTLRPKPTKTIRRRTRILNKELKKFARIKSYSQYVKIKTKILREVSEDEFVEEESFENDQVARIQSSRESIPVPGPSNEKLSRTSKGKTQQKKDHQHNHKTKNNAREQNFSRAKKNLSGILEILDISNVLGDESETVDEVIEDVGNNEASRRVKRKSKIPMANVPLGDSGIDDNSQANSLTSSHENNDDAEGINSTEMADTIAEESNDLSNTFTQANSTTASMDEGEEFDSNEDRARKLSQSAKDDNEIEEISDEVENAEELSLGEIMDNEVKEYASTNEKNENSSQSDIHDDKMENIIAEKKAEKISQSDLDGIEEYATKGATVEKNLSSDVDNDEIREPLARAKKVEILSQSNENGESTTTDKRIEELSQSDENEESSTTEKRIEELSQSDENEESSTTEKRIEGLSQSDDKEDEMEKVSPKEESVQNKIDDTKDDRIEESWAKDEPTETFSQPDMNDDSFKKKNQLTITCTEIVTSKYTIIRDEIEKEEHLENHSPEFEIVENNKPTEFDETSSETDRVGKLKRLNLLCSGTESESSEEDVNMEQTKVQTSAHPVLSSQVISDPSDSENSDSLALHITDSEDGKVTSTPYCKQQRTEISRSGLVKKSIKDQIKEQSIIDSSVRVEEKSVNNKEEEEQVDCAENEEIASPENQQSEVSEKMNETPKRKDKKKQQLYETESLQYVLKNISKRNCNDENLVVEARIQNDEENLPRPTELHDFVAREELIPTNTSSTITLKDISKISKRQDDDEEIWFMEIPKSIVTDPGLCGRSILLQKDQITIGDTNYNVTLKHTKAVSCILRKNEKKTLYKAVNIRPVHSINVRHERTESEEFIPSKASPPEKSVPFPKNIKSRNPLIVGKKAEVSSSENTDPIGDKEKTKRQNAKKRKRSIWHMDNFILKPKRKKIDGCWMNGSINADLFNE